MKDVILGIPGKFYAFSPNSDSKSGGFGSARVLTLSQAAFATTPMATFHHLQPEPHSMNTSFKGLIWELHETALT